MNDISRSYLAARAALPPTRLVPAWLALALDVEFGEQASAIAALWTARHPAVVREDGSTGIDDRHEEYGDLLELLLEGAATSSTHTVAIARWIALSCFGEDHLWEDLGLPERPALGALIARHFPALHARNVHNLRWKKFFYKQLCDLAQVRACRAPSCAECSEYAGCFEGSA